MTKSILTAIAITIGSLALATSASAQHMGGHGWHGGFHDHDGFRDHDRFDHRFHGGGRFWNGRWWGYGSSCWAPTPYGWQWVCGY